MRENLEKLIDIFTNYRCGLCGKEVKYVSIENDLGSKLKEYGFPYKLADFETISYRKYKCPSCGAADRDRLYKIYIDKFENFDKNTKILDFAPSKQIESYLRPKTNYRSADLLIDGVDDKIDITNMEYKNNTFDFFICSHILEHVDDDAKALSELYRVLKYGGRGILMTPIIDKNGVQDEDPSIKDVSERWRRFAQDDHVRLYQKDVFLNRVKQAGFVVRQYNYKSLGLWSIIKNGITLKSTLYILEKKK